MRQLFLLLLLLSLVGCSQVSDLLVKDLTAATGNLEIAIKSGQLPTDDPLLPCLNSFLNEVKSVTGTSYKFDGLMSTLVPAYVAYNNVYNAPKLQQTFSACDAIVGKFMRDGIKSSSPFRLP